MYVHGIINDTHVNGPGNRIGIWAAGCTLKCPGCWNPDTHAHGGGIWWDDIALARHILSKNQIEGVTFSGGEPLQQTDSLLRIVDFLHFRRPALSIGIYTGYTLKELDKAEYDVFTSCLVGEAPNGMWPPLSTWWPELRSHLDFAIMGRFNAGKVTRQLPLRGSANQELVFFSDRYTEKDFGEQLVEITIAADGQSSTLTGFPIGLRDHFQQGWHSSVVEHSLGKGEVESSSLSVSSIL